MEAKEAFARRLAFLDWHADRQPADLFKESPAALVKWAPIAPELKRHDEEIVENSIRFKWRDIRAQFEKRVDGAAIVAELNTISGAGRET